MLRLMQAPIDTVLMDFDGVSGVVDVERVLAATTTLRRWFRLDPATVIEQYFYGNPENVNLDLGRTDTFEVREALRPQLWTGPADTWHGWWRSIEDAYEMPESIAGLIDRWRGRVVFVMLTDNHRDFRAWFDAREDYARRFDRLVCSAEIGLKKPDPGVFLHAVDNDATRLGRCIYVDDSAANVAAAALLGVPGIAVADIEASAARLERCLGGRETIIAGGES